jgi:hypothetical protein
MLSLEVTWQMAPPPALQQLHHHQSVSDAYFVIQELVRPCAYPFGKFVQLFDGLSLISGAVFQPPFQPSPSPSLP